MSQTLTIRNVPDALARWLKTSAERNHRSLQGEVMAILEQASADHAEQPAARYRANATANPADRKAVGNAPRLTGGTAGNKLTIEEIWERGKRLGLSTPNESARIIRKSRDERHGR